MRLLKSSFLFLVLSVPALAQRAIPALTGPVMDETSTLSGAEVGALSSELRQYPPKMQLQIWIVPDLQGEPIENLSIRATDAWKLGKKGDDRGVLLLMALGDRKVRIEVGKGLEGDIPDIISGRIIDGILRPAFRSGDYYTGLQQASRALFQRAGGDVANLPEIEPQRSSGRNSGSNIKLILILIYIVVFGLFRLIFPRRSRFGGGWWGGGGFGGGGFSGGGGGWSGGGGGFSGGGASGDW